MAQLFWMSGRIDPFKPINIIIGTSHFIQPVGITANDSDYRYACVIYCRDLSACFNRSKAYEAL